MFTITQELEVISIKKMHPLLKQTHEFFFSVCVKFFCSNIDETSDSNDNSDRTTRCQDTGFDSHAVSLF